MSIIDTTVDKDLRDLISDLFTQAVDGEETWDATWANLRETGLARLTGLRRRSTAAVGETHEVLPQAVAQPGDLGPDRVVAGDGEADCSVELVDVGVAHVGFHHDAADTGDGERGAHDVEHHGGGEPGGADVTRGDE